MVVRFIFNSPENFRASINQIIKESFGCRIILINIRKIINLKSFIQMKFMKNTYLYPIIINIILLISNKLYQTS